MKNNEKLLYTIGEVDENAVPNAPEKRKGTGWIKWAAIGSGLCAAAAVLAVVLMGGAGGNNHSLPNSYETSDTFNGTDTEPEQSVSDNTEDPTLTSPDPAVTTNHIDWAEVSIYPEFNWERNDDELEPITPQIGSGGMGFEGIGAKDLSELKESHSTKPWTPDMVFEALPVFRNQVFKGFLSSGGIFIYLSEEEMKTIAENTAYILGTEITSMDTRYGEYVERTDDYPTQEAFESAPMMAHEVTAQCADGTEIRVDGAGGIRIELGTPVHFPEDCGFDTPERENAAMEFLAEKYRDLLQFENPSFFGDSGYHCIYDKSGDEVQQILNYCMYIARFCIYDYGDMYDNGDMYLIYFDNGFVSSEYMGDYPVITLDKAQEMLLEGKYVTTVPSDFMKNSTISAEDIAFSELTYRCSSGHDAYFQPYYRFYVELDMDNDGEKHYGAFYVPAVSEEYLSDITLWDGSFN